MAGRHRLCGRTDDDLCCSNVWHHRNFGVCRDALRKSSSGTEQQGLLLWACLARWPASGSWHSSQASTVVTALKATPGMVPASWVSLLKTSC